MMNIFETSRHMFVRVARGMAAVFGMLAIALSFTFPVSAQSRGGWSVSSFEADLFLRADGTLEVTETIEGSFAELRHGMYRFIPERIERIGLPDRFLEITVKEVLLDGQPVPYETQESGGQEVMRIGDPDREFEGPFTYRISYEVEDVALQEEGVDAFLWNITGDGWDIPLTSISAILRIEHVSGEEMEVVCLRGSVPLSEDLCAIEKGNDRLVVSSRDGIRLEVRFPSGRVAALSASDVRMSAVRHQWPLLFFLLPILACIFMYRRWSKDGRDPKAPAVDVVQYDSPDGLSPVEMFGVMSSSLSSEVLAAFFIHLAERGYLTIEEGEKSWFGKAPYTLRRLPKTEGLTAYEETFLSSVFEGEETHTLTSPDVKTQKAWAELQKSVYSVLVEKGYYPPGNAYAQTPYVVVAFLLVFSLGFISGPINRLSGNSIPTIAVALTALVIFLFGLLMGKRTPKGAEAYAHARGFRLYLKKAEKYRTIWQEQEGIFERLLPYAIGFGVGKKWAAAVAPTLVNPSSAPAWYVASSGGAFNAGSFASDMSSFANAVSSSSSSSGGGSSGGGGGGGGGGSW